MADRRMFAKTIIDSDAFLDMPLSSQSLYFHLSMRADDDGFLNNPKKVQRMIGASDDDLKLLIAKKFLIPFESGVVVIKHWKIHNYIQKDRYKPTVYAEEKAQLRMKENKAYSLTEGHALDTECVQKKDEYTNWKTSEKARMAVAGKLVDDFVDKGYACANLSDLHGMLVKALSKGIAPGMLEDFAKKASTWSEFMVDLSMRGVFD